MESIIVSMETIVPRSGSQEAHGSSLEVHVGYWLRRVSNHVSSTFARALNAQHASVAEWVVLRTLTAGEQTTSSELAEALGRTRGAVSKILDKLEAKEWTRRLTSPHDNRVKLLSVTRRGHRILPQLAKIADDNDENAFGCLDVGERATLLRLLQKVADLHNIRDVPIE